MPPVSPRIDPLVMYAAAAIISGFAGIAALLREPTPLSLRACVSAFLNSSLFGLAVTLIWSWWLPAGQNEWVPLAFAIIIGLAGNKSIEYVYRLSSLILSKMLPKFIGDDDAAGESEKKKRRTAPVDPGSDLTPVGQ